MVGKTVSHYRILEKLGEGGMGVVYKAEDTRLERVVALKFLSLASIGEEEKKRFKREAKAAASLNHLNIATVHAIDEADGQTFIAMEFIEGQSVEEIVGSNGGSPVPIDKAIDYATQISAGLQAAHEKGITHRDIKSANIMVTAKGQIKIMDFGLAKLANRSKMTQLGTTLGTAAYMSPEQSRGENTDHRADIWSLGVVLYEMISGQMPFKGDYEQAVIYSIQNEDPEPLTALRSGVPIALDGIIAKTLAKDPQDRYQHVEEVPVDLRKIDLKATGISRISTSRTMPAVTQSTATSQRSNRLNTIVMTGIVSVIVGALVWFLKPEKPEPTPIVARLSIVSDSSSRISQAAISPDGRFVAYRNSDEDRLYLRRIDQQRSYPIAGTDNAIRPFFSPDNRWLGFHTDDKLQKVLIEGGSPIPITEFKNTAFSSWGPNGTIIFDTWGGESSLYQVSSLGGTPELIIKPDKSKHEFSYSMPKLLPDQKSVLFEIGYFVIGYGGRWVDSTAVAILDLASKKHRVLINDATRPSYSPTGHLVWIQRSSVAVPLQGFPVMEGQLLAARFDLEDQRITGSAVPIAPGVGGYSFSSNGTLVYNATGLFRRDHEYEQSLAWLDIQGKETTISQEKTGYHNPRLSPDGNKITLARVGEGKRSDVLVYDLELGKFDPLTFQGENDDPCWSPDGEYVTYVSRQKDKVSLINVKADGSAAPKEIWSGRSIAHPDWSPDGKWLAFEVDSENDRSIWIYSAEQDTALKFTGSNSIEQRPRFSPDGKWIAYSSYELDETATYVKPFPDSGGRWKVSGPGGFGPVWSRDGQMLYYRSRWTIMGVKVQTEPVFAKLGNPEELLTNTDMREFTDIHPDGVRFLVKTIKSSDMDSEKEIHVVLNWFEELKRLVPVEK